MDHKTLKTSSLNGIFSSRSLLLIPFLKLYKFRIWSQSISDLSLGTIRIIKHIPLKMASRVTRSSIAKEAAALPHQNKQKLSSKASTMDFASIAKPDILSLVKGDSSRTPANTSKKRKRTSTINDGENISALRYNVRRISGSNAENVLQTQDMTDRKPSAKRKSPKKSLVKNEEIVKVIEPAKDVDGPKPSTAAPSKTNKESKVKSYGLTPGISPFPDWPHPTPDECKVVNGLLSKVHGVHSAPPTIPAPSLTSSGCGEVPSILDAMIRTRLSASTTGINSARAFQGLVDKFGILKEGIGKGSVNWDAVRRADQNDVMEAIKSGGLAVVKSKDIKAILEMVYEENQNRREKLLKAEKEVATTAPTGPKSAKNERPSETEAEISRAEQHILSLDHLHALNTQEAMEAMVRYPGIGVKTASCVLLFCMRRPSFAVDTHVFRLLKWLKWVPPSVKKVDDAYRHAEVRVPNSLKYSLHTLFIKHGKTCPRCKASTGPSSEGWDKGCVIDHLMERTEKRKLSQGGQGRSEAKKGKQKKKIAESDEDDELTELETGDEEADYGS